MDTRFSFREEASAQAEATPTRLFHLHLLICSIIQPKNDYFKFSMVVSVRKIS